jgi:ABC-type sugar transport system ATPase subunit
MNSQAKALATNYGFSVQPTAAVSQLSTADCQIVELLKALRRNSSIIVMDEPTSSLSENEARRLFEVVRQLRSRGLAIIYISHRLEEVLDLADDISILRDGKVVHSAPATGLDLGTIVQHMVGRELKDVFPKERGVHAASTSERQPRDDQSSAPPTPTARTPRVEVRNLSSVEGIHAVSFRIKAGEIVGMAGLVGSGRTEVARALFGVEPKTSGELLLDGQPVEIASPADAVRNGIALLTEDRKRTGLCLELPCYWNVTLPNLDRLGMSRFLHPAVEMRIAGATATRVRLKWPSPSASANSLSGGNQQKLLVARWLLAQSRFMIFDEPTRGIDIGAKREIYVLLQTLAAEGKAILFISSELPELFGVADRILVMRRGRCVGNVETPHTNPSQIMHLAAIEEPT